MEEPQASDDAHLLPPGGDRSLDDLSSPPRMHHETTKAPTDPLPQRTWWQAFIAFCDIVFYYPLQAQEFIDRLASKFGWRYVGAVVVVYGFQQGWSQSWSMIAQYWYMLDPRPEGLEWSPQTFTMVMQFSSIPWQIKAIYGIISDTFPIYGRARSPYIVIASVAGLVGFLLLAAEFTTSTLGIGTLLMLTSFAQSVPDVMVDASVTERIKVFPELATDLQTLCWASYFLFSCALAEPGAYFQRTWGARTLLLVVAGLSLLTLYVGVNCWLGDRPKLSQELPDSKVTMAEHGPVAACTAAVVPQSLRRNFTDPLKGPVFKLAVYVTVVAVGQGLLAYAVSTDLDVSLIGIATIFAMCAGSWYWLSQVSNPLARAVVLIFLLGASTPSTGVMAVWSKETNPPWDTDCGSADAPPGSHALDMYEHKWCHQCAVDRPYLEHGYSRPCFDAPYLGLVSICANLFGFVGTLWYNSYFSHWSYKNILYTTQVAFVVLGFTDLLWVYRWNRMLGLSDDLFVMGQEVLLPVIGRLSAMPVLILAAQLCPDSVEATLYALIMGISNMSFSTGNYVGVGLLSSLRVVTPWYNHMGIYVVIRNLGTFVTVFFIYLLCPDGSPKTPATEMQSRSQHGDQSDLKWAYNYGSGEAHPDRSVVWALWPLGYWWRPKTEPEVKGRAPPPPASHSTPVDSVYGEAVEETEGTEEVEQTAAERMEEEIADAKAAP